MGYGIQGPVAVGVGASILWVAVAVALGRNYEKRLRYVGSREAGSD
jgi:hypothetical protein